MSKEVHRKPPGSSEQRDQGPVVGALCPASDCWEGDDEEDVLRPLYDVPLSRAEPSLSCLANLGAWQLLLYLSTSNQLPSHGPKIAVLRKALRGKQLGGRGLAQLGARLCACGTFWECLLCRAGVGWPLGEAEGSTGLPQATLGSATSA